MAKSSAKSSADLKGYTSFFLFAGTLVALDQLTKYLLSQALSLDTGKVIIPGFFNLVHVRNTGGAFSIFAGSGSEWRRPLFVILALVVVGIITYAYGKVAESDIWDRAAYSFIAGGAVGNMVDRLLTGSVIDFLDFHAGAWHWPAFNVADIAISTGAIMLLISLVKGK